MMIQKRRPLEIVFAIITVMIWNTEASSEIRIPEGPYRYAEDFETKADVKPWTSRGKFKVNFAGLSDERVRSGKKSFKLDITFVEATDYNYWSGPLLDLPAVKGMRLGGDIYVDQAPAGVSVGLGASYYIPALKVAKNADGRGAVQPLGEISASRAGEWFRHEGDLDIIGDSLSKKTVGESTPDVRFEKWALLIYCRNVKPGSRLVVYLDNVSIEGEIPKDWYKRNELHFTDWRIQFETRQNANYNRYKADLAQFNHEVRKIQEQIPPAEVIQRVPADSWRDYAAALHQTLREKTDAALVATTPATPLPVDPDEAVHDLWDRQIRPLKAGATNLVRMRGKTDPYLIFSLQRPVTNYRILPASVLIDGMLDAPIELTAAPGEYEPGSFVILSNQEMTVEMEASDLRSGTSTIPSQAIDIRAVKVWYQAGESIYELNKRILMPELLLHDDELIQVDFEGQKNILQDIDRPQDAATLQPVRIPRRFAKQFWLTVGVPDDAAEGSYKGVIRIRSDNAPDRELELNVRVLPFPLAAPAKDYGLYYRAQLTDDPPDHVSSEYKTEAQLEAEFRDMQQHGILFPNIYQSVSMKGNELDAGMLTRYLEIKKNVGLPLSPLLMVSIGSNEVATEEAFAGRVRLYEKFMEYARSTGITEVYFYGQDEAAGEQLRRQREMWQAVHRAGGKTWVACSTGFFDLVGDLLDLPVIARGSPDEVPRVHELGRKAWVYSWPLRGAITEAPYSQRQSWGLRLDRSGLDGIHNYCYQHAEGPGGMAGRAWDDFDSSIYRSMCYTYPTLDGVVPTLQWEAVREGIDDMRYLTTLRHYIEVARKSGNAQAIAYADQAAAWTTTPPINRDLHEVREEMIQRILRLRELSR